MKVKKKYVNYIRAIVIKIYVIKLFSDRWWLDNKGQKLLRISDIKGEIFV